MKILVFGAEGRVGRELVPFLSIGDVYPLSRKNVDLRFKDKVIEVLNSINPGVIVNCAAYTNVDNAEIFKEECFLINATFVDWISNWAENRKTYLIHISTDYVFDGNKRIPYTEDDPTCPLNFYGFSKLTSEKLSLSYDQSLIVRTSYLFSKNSKNLVTHLIQSALTQKELKIVKDQTISLTLISELVRFIVECIKNRPTGLYHFANYGAVSLEEFVNEISIRLGEKANYWLVSLEELSRPAKRPSYSALDSSKGKVIFKTVDWRIALGYIFQQVK